MTIYNRLIKTFSAIGLIALISCNNNLKNYSDQETLYFADCIKDLNTSLQKTNEKYLDKYYLDDSLRGKDSINDKKFYFATLIYGEKLEIDSLYKLLNSVLFINEKYKSIDTMPYITAPNIIDMNKNIETNIVNNISDILNVLKVKQTKLIEIRHEIEKLRPGTKNELIDCQLCRQNVNVELAISSHINPAIFYTNIEKAFNLVYREMNCCLFTVSLLNVRKVAQRNYKVRI
jgi:hypothetical protein